MPIRVKCKCGKKFGAPSKYAGKKVKCPACSTPLVIPKSDGTAKASKESVAKKIAVKCKCGKSFAAKAEWNGKTVRCPGCKEPIKIGKSKSKPAAVKTKPPKTKPAKPEVEDTGLSDDMFEEVGIGKGGPGRRCPECNASMAEEAILCIDCGYNEKLGRKMVTKRPITQADRDAAHEAKTLTGDNKKSKKKK